jgi:predicted O-methyltransferase YrrM
MSNKTWELNPHIYDYLISVSLREPEILRQLREETANHPMGVMQIAPEQGQFMSLLVQLMNAKKILEIGVFTGYSSLSMALALPPEGQIIACDVSEEYTSIARRYWERAGLANKINLRLAPALETLDELIASGETESFDFVFIDADKENHPAYFERALILVRQGGLIVVDNAFWDGKVADAQYQDEETQAIRTLNEKLHYDDRVSLSLLPIADGLVLALKR